MQKRIKKAVLLVIRKIALHAEFLTLYYWSDVELSKLRVVCVMPIFYYRWLYQTCMWLIEHQKYIKFADSTIHRIPFHIRSEVA